MVIWAYLLYNAALQRSDMPQGESYVRRPGVRISGRKREGYRT